MNERRGAFVRPVILLAACLLLLAACTSAALSSSSAGQTPQDPSSVTVASLPGSLPTDDGPPVSLAVDEKEITYTPDGPFPLVYCTILNHERAGESYLAIPALCQKDADGAWQALDYAPGIGFCGTPDPLDADEVMTQVPLSFFALPDDWAGEYRLSLEVQMKDGGTMTVSDTFALVPEDAA